jgi:hypothetical protein
MKGDLNVFSDGDGDGDGDAQHYRILRIAILTSRSRGMYKTLWLSTVAFFFFFFSTKLCFGTEVRSKIEQTPLRWGQKCKIGTDEWEAGVWVFVCGFVLD